jgi:hypothetical protein
MLGGARGDVAVAESGSDCVHLWSDPPKLIFVGSGVPPSVNGVPALEISLRSGDQIEWHGHSWNFGHEDGSARLEEVREAPPPPPVAASLTPIASASAAPRADAPAPAERGSSAETSSEPTWRRLKAGLVAEMALSDRAVIKHWQEAVIQNEFDPEAATRELLAGAPGIADHDPRLAERSTRLLRDLLMSSVTRSAGRQVRKAARNGLAFILVQGFIFVLFTLLVLAGMLLIRTRGSSIDAFLDAVVDFF